MIAKGEDFALKGNYKKAFECYEKALVPKYGSAETVQGELIRAIRRLEFEDHANGNMNWSRKKDNYYRCMCNFLEEILCTSDIFNEKSKKEISHAIAQFKDYKYPSTEDDLYDIMKKYIIDWISVNKELIYRESSDIIDEKEYVIQLLREGLNGPSKSHVQLSEQDFSLEEIEALSWEIQDPVSLLFLWGKKNNAPSYFFLYLYVYQHNVEFAKWGVKNDAPVYFFRAFSDVIKNIELAKWGVKNDAPSAFYRGINKLSENIELAKLGVQKNAPVEFYSNFHKLKENIELAKWGIKNDVIGLFYYRFDKFQKSIEFIKLGVEKGLSEAFFRNYDKLNENIELAKWGVNNNAPISFYSNFDKIQENIEMAKWGVLNKAPVDYYKNFSKLNQDPLIINSIGSLRDIKEIFIKRFNR